VGEKPVHSVVSADNSTLYVSNFGSNNVTIYAIDLGKVVGSVAVGDKPDALALTANQSYVLVANTGSGDLAVVRVVRFPTTSKFSKDQNLVTTIPVGAQPNDIVVKAFNSK
jgi:DNA-binding beta-propeller fold protein YncE